MLTNIVTDSILIFYQIVWKLVKEMYLDQFGEFVCGIWGLIKG